VHVGPVGFALKDWLRLTLLHQNVSFKKHKVRTSLKKKTEKSNQSNQTYCRTKDRRSPNERSNNPDERNKPLPPVNIADRSLLAWKKSR
jgi:hypothetical protein